jgi:ADP-heptose:LPS heptosyltransferase
MGRKVSDWVKRWEPRFTRTALRLFPKSSAPAQIEDPRSILVVKSCCMGDAVLSLYALRAFHLRNPECRIELLVSNRIDAVYASVDFIEKVHVLPLSGFHLGRELLSFKLWVQLVSLWKVLRKKQFDWLVDMELYRTFGPLLSRMLGIGWSRGFAVPGAPPKAHDVQIFRGKTDPEWMCFYAVLGLPRPSATPKPIYPLERSNPPSTPKTKIGLVYGSSSNWPQKRWPISHFIELARELQKRDFHIVLFGSTHESDLGLQLQDAISECQNTTGRLDFAQLIETLQECQLVLGNDTGTLHAAAAAGVRVVTLFGPTSPAKWNPLTSRPIFLPGLECRPCYYLSSMPECSHRSCLTQMAPKLVLDIVLEEVSRYRPQVEMQGDKTW